MEPTYVNLNHGRWCVGCPACRTSYYGDRDQAPDVVVHLPNGTLVHAADLSLTVGQESFVCTMCGAESEVVWPTARSRAAILDAVAPRPVDARNWRPGDRVADMLDDNRSMLDAANAGLAIVHDPPKIIVAKRPAKTKFAGLLADLDDVEYVMRHVDYDAHGNELADAKRTVEIELADGSTHSVDDVRSIVAPHTKLVD